MRFLSGKQFDGTETQRKKVLRKAHEDKIGERKPFCGIGKRPDKAQGVCVDCPQWCESCDVDTGCTKCMAGAALRETIDVLTGPTIICSLVCEPGEYRTGDSCTACDASCDTVGQERRAHVVLASSCRQPYACTCVGDLVGATQ